MIPYPDVLSPLFFEMYDNLGHDAAVLEDVRAQLQDAKAKRVTSQQNLSLHQEKLRLTRKNIKEQQDRIDIVTNHWFYGTTFLQPQLWLRGGCRGKIHRARIKLRKAQDQDLPTIMQIIHQVQTVELPKLEMEVDLCLGKFEISVNAASEREVLRHRLFQMFPSTQLCHLQDQEDFCRSQRTKFQQQASHLEDVITKLLEARKIYHHSRGLLDDALQHNIKLEQLKHTREMVPRPIESLNSLQHRSRNETMVADGTKIITIEKRDGEQDIFHLDQSGRVLSTNYPCPNGCGFLVTWHETHCCDCCKQQIGKHGRRCERKAVTSQQGAQQKLKKWKNKQKARLRSMNFESESCKSLVSQARRDAKIAEKTTSQALEGLNSTIGGGGCHSSITSTRSLVPTIDTLNIQHGDCSCPHLRPSDIENEVVSIAIHESTLSCHLSMARQLQAKACQDVHHLEDELTSITPRLKEEQDRIFDQVRVRVQGVGCQSRDNEHSVVDDPTMLRPPPFAPHQCPVATAPLQDEDDEIPMTIPTLTNDLC